MPCDHYIVHYVVICCVVSFAFGYVVSKIDFSKHKQLDGGSTRSARASLPFLLKSKQPGQQQAMPTWSCHSDESMLKFLQSPGTLHGRSLARPQLIF